LDRASDFPATRTLATRLRPRGLEPGPFRDPLPSGSEPNEVVNPKGSVKRRAREFWREIGRRAGPTAISARKQRTLSAHTCGRKSLRRLRKNENAERENSRRFE
jgi:hypothetical protein